MYKVKCCLVTVYTVWHFFVTSFLNDEHYFTVRLELSMFYLFIPHHFYAAWNTCIKIWRNRVSGGIHFWGLKIIVFSGVCNWSFLCLKLVLKCFYVTAVVWYRWYHEVANRLRLFLVGVFFKCTEQLNYISDCVSLFVP